jgi:hypothetical protein
MNDSAFNFNDADKQRSLSIIPPGIYRLRAKVKMFNGDRNYPLRPAKSGRTEGLDLELTVVGGGHRGAKLRDLITVTFDDREYDDPDIMPLDADATERFRTAVRIGRGKLRTILESAHAIAPDDDSEPAKEKRTIKSWLDFDGIEFWAHVDTRKGTNGYQDRSEIKYVITPDLPNWPREAARQPRQVVPLAKELDDEISF